MKALIFGILGAVAAALYWRYAVYAHPLSLEVDWMGVERPVLIYAAAGFVLGWIIGFAVSKIGHHDL